MAVVVNSNIAALRAQRRLNASTASLSRSFERLSSGLRINRPGDEPGGLSVAAGLNVDSRVFGRAVMNANDGISQINIASGALDSAKGILVRLKELASQASNGTLTNAQRRSLDSEANSLTQEYNRLLASTTFNGSNLLQGGNGNTTLQLGYGLSQISYALTGDLETDQGTGGFGSPTVYSGGTSATITADIDNDGDQDIISAGGGTKIDYRKNVNGAFGGTVQLSAGGTVTGVVAGDFNGDGKQDIVAATASDLYYFQGDGGGGFGAAVNTNLTVINTLGELKAGDFNHDGKLDLAMVGGAGAVAVSRGLGNGLFSTSLTSFGSGLGTSIELGDVNNDGNLDIAYTDTISSLAKVRTGNADGTFNAAVNIAIVGASRDIALGDLNHDGYDDLVSTADSVSYTVALSNGNGSFGASTTVSAPNTGGKLKLGDLNNDGYLDLVSYGSGRLTTSFGIGDGTFTTDTTAAMTAFANSDLALADFNGDEVLDAYLGYTTGNNEVRFATTSKTTTIARLSLLSQAEARATFATIDSEITRISQQQGTLGAAMSRAQTAVSVLEQSREGYLASASQIMDVDVAEESANLVRQQILQKAGAAILSQANQLPALALQLLGRISR